MLHAKYVPNVKTEKKNTAVEFMGRLKINKKIRGSRESFSYVFLSRCGKRFTLAESAIIFH